MLVSDVWNKESAQRLKDKNKKGNASEQGSLAKGSTADDSNERYYIKGHSNDHI